MKIITGSLTPLRTCTLGDVKVGEAFIWKSENLSGGENKTLCLCLEANSNRVKSFDFVLNQVVTPHVAEIVDVVACVLTVA